MLKHKINNNPHCPDSKSKPELTTLQKKNTDQRILSCTTKQDFIDYVADLDKENRHLRGLISRSTIKTGSNIAKEPASISKARKRLEKVKRKGVEARNMMADLKFKQKEASLKRFLAVAKNEFDTETYQHIIRIISKLDR